MPAVIDFEPDKTSTIDFTPDVDFEPDNPTATATTKPLHEQITSDLSSGDPARIATALIPLTSTSNQALKVGLDQAEAMQNEKAASLPSPVEALKQDPRAYRKPPGMIETAFGAIGEAAAAALNIPQAMVRDAIGVTPKQFTISTDESGKEQLKQEEVPLHFQAGKPAIQFPRTEFQPEGNTIGRLIEGLMTPENIALFPLTASRTVQAAFLSQMAPAAVEAAIRFVSPDTPPDQRREASTELLINGLMSYGIAKHLATTPEAVALAPKTTLETAETIKKTEAQSASQVSNATGVSQLEVRSRVGEETPLRQPGETATQTLTPATDKAVEETATPGGGLSTKSPEELARHESARLETEANMRKELEGGGTAVTSQVEAVGNEAQQFKSEGKLTASDLKVGDVFQTSGDKRVAPVGGTITKVNPKTVEVKTEYMGNPMTLKLRKDGLTGEIRIKREGRYFSSEHKEVETRFGQGGPGSAAAGEPGSYEPAVELSDALKTVRDPDPLTRAQVMEKMTDIWEAGKTAAQKAWGRVVAAKESIKSNLTTLPEATPVKRLVAALDFQIQKSSAMSRELGKTFEQSHPNRTRRNGIAVFVDSGLDPAKVRAAIAQLPANTPRKIRKAFEAAADLNPAERDTAERIKHYFDQRLQDAQQAGVLDRFLEDYYTHVWKRPERMPEELKNAMRNGRVVSYFENARERKLDDFITGVKLGLEPVLDPAAVVPRYNFNLDRAIASRAFVKKLSETTEADGRPTVAPKGTGEVVQGSGNTATIIKPNAKAGEAADYQEVNNPALRKWKWATNAPDGSPVLVEGDLVVHPDAAQRIKNIMERERLTASTPMRVAIRAGAEVKGAKLGVLSPFHQIHVGSHALFHLVNPFSLKPEIDWTHPATKFAVEQGGLKLSADFHDKTAFTEGVGPGLIAQKIVPYARAYSEYLFESFIPRLKLKTFEAAYNRNIWARDNLPGAVTGLKGLSDAQIAARAGDSVNNAYGELNRLWLGKNGRDPRLQRAMQVTLLAPDFLEARGRFLAKALTKSGFEERMALFVMGASLYTISRVLNQLIDGDPHMEPGMMFSVRYKDTNYSIRSVLGDTEHALTDWRSFIAHRINPLTTRTAVELVTRRDIKTGESRTTIEQFQDLLDQIRPSQVDSMFANDREWYDGLVQSIGLTKRHQPTPQEIQKREDKARKEQLHPSKVEIIYKKDYRTLDKNRPGIKPTPK